MTPVEKYSHLKTRRIDLRAAIPLAKPFAVLLEPTNICNFRCTCCFQSDPEFFRILPRGRMAWDDFERIATDLAAWPGPPLKVIRIIGFGEPLLHPDTPEMVRRLKELNLAERVEITTNASLLDEAVSKRLIAAGLDYLRCSLYAADQTGHERITRSAVPLAQIRENILRLRQLRTGAQGERPFIYVKMLKQESDRENRCFLEQYAGMADEVALESPHNWLAADPSGSAVTRRVCPQPFKMMSIRYNGDVILCDPDWRGHTIVGNALESPIGALWGNRTMRAFWRLQLENRRQENPSCRQCSFLTDDYAIDNLDGLSPEALGEDRHE